ncbi:MAG TPA: hypothetical protein VFS41_00515 [Edaphobacter sp.]|nr:hypothetical protein [Edaphobacter sp.]
MEITSRELWTLVHGMGFGVLYLMACTGALVELYRRFLVPSQPQPTGHRFLEVYLIVMAVLGWLSVLTGTYIVYPWYRATPPAGTVDLSGFPQKLLMASPTTIEWHSMGMEWKEHVAWFVPITITMAAVVVARYKNDLRNHPKLRFAVLGAVLFSFASAGLAGFWGAMIDKAAPVEGGQTIRVMGGTAR